jgi:hypothetical protein
MMSRYFMRDTPLRFYERLMMAPPNYRQKGHGYVLKIEKYTPEKVDCEYCACFTGQPCPLSECGYLMERASAGTVTLRQLIADCFQPKRAVKLRKRLRTFMESSSGVFRNDLHQCRWLKWRSVHPNASDSLKAAVFLLTAYDELMDNVLPFVREDVISFESVRLRGIRAEQYAVYQAVKTIITGSDGITMDDLAYPELVGGEAFRLIVTALLLARYGEVVFVLKKGRQTDAV